MPRIPLTPEAYERELRRAAAVPPSVAAIPQTEEISLAYAAGQAEKNARGRAVADQVRLSDRALALQHDELDAWAAANRWAVPISLVNIGVTVMGGLAQDTALEEQQARQDRMIARMEESGAAQRAGYESLAAANAGRGEQALRAQEAAGLRYEETLRDVAPDVIDRRRGKRWTELPGWGPRVN